MLSCTKVKKKSVACFEDAEDIAIENAFENGLISLDSSLREINRFGVISRRRM